MKATHPQNHGHRCTLSDAAESTAIPAAAICRYLSLNLIEPDGALATEPAFNAETLKIIIRTRVMELLDCNPAAIRGFLNQYAQDPHAADRALQALATPRAAARPEIPHLLRQMGFSD